MKKNILIIDDNEAILESMAELLQLEGFDVLSADCGLNALVMANRHTPDLIICDIVMGVMDGYEVLSALRHNTLTCDIPFIFSTANSQKADLQKAKDHGVTHNLVKPFDGRELLACINNCLQEYPQRKQRANLVLGAPKI